jgi:hypothetical protein
MLNGCPLGATEIARQFKKVSDEYYRQCCIRMSASQVKEVSKKETASLIGDEEYVDYIDSNKVEERDEVTKIKDYAISKSFNYHVYAFYAKATREIKGGNVGGAADDSSKNGFVRLYDTIVLNGQVEWFSLGHELGHVYGLGDLRDDASSSNWMYSQSEEKKKGGAIGGLGKKAAYAVNRRAHFAEKQCKEMRTSLFLW